MCAASLAKYRRPAFMGSTTKLRIGHVLVENWTNVRLPSVAGSHALKYLFPDGIIRPIANIFIGRNLEVEAGDLLRAHTVQCEAAFAVGINQRLRRRGRLRKNAEPAERIGAIVAI